MRRILVLVFLCLAAGLAAQNGGQRIYDLQAESLRGNITPSLGRASRYLVSIKNNYSGTIGGFYVQLLCAGQVLADTYVQSIGPYSHNDYLINWTPSYSGNYELYARTILAGDLNPANDSTATVSATVQAHEVKLCTLGGNTEPLRIPLDFNARNSVCDLLYLQGELSYTGIITQLTLYNDFPEAAHNKHLRFWLGITTATNLTGWFPWASLTQVFDGRVDFPAGVNAIILPLQQPFQLPPGSNLVMRSQRCFEMLTYGEDSAFRAMDVPTLRGRIKSYPNLIDPEAPGDYYNNISELPQTGFLFAPDNAGPLLNAAPAEVNFGVVRMDFGHAQTLYLSNTGSSPFTLNSIAIAAPPGDFVLAPLPDLPLTLQPAQAINFEIYFQPQTLALQTRFLEVATDTGTYNVTLKGSGFDPTLRVLPHEEDFDALDVGALPVDWSALVQSTYPHAYVMAMSERTHSAPRAAEIYNHWDTAATLLLVSPPVADSITMQQLRLIFWHFGYSSSTLRVGVMDDPHNPDTFFELASIVQGYAWGQHIVPLAAYTGMGRYIAFRYGGGTLAKLVLDDIRIERVPTADLAALTLSGEMLVSLTQPAVHTLTLRNIGTQTQDGYEISLWAGDALLATVPGISLTPGQTAQVPIPWQPSYTGDLQLRARIDLTADAFTDNNLSPAFQVWTEPDPLFNLGDGSEHWAIPFDTGYHYGIYETIIPASELQGLAGTIERLWLYAYNHTQYITQYPVYVWLGATLWDDLEQGWIPAGQLDPVFYGNVRMTGYVYPLPIDLDQPFIYNGGNLALMVYHPVWTALTASNYFQAQTGEPDRSRRFMSSYTDPDPYNPPAATASQLYGRYPRLGIAHAPANGESGALLVTVRDANGQPLPDAALRFRYTSQTGATGPAGSYYFATLIPGAYHLLVSKPGYSSLDLIVDIMPGSDHELDCVLSAVANADPNVPEPAATALLGCRPNPFADTARIEFALREAGPVSLSVYNLRGQLIRELAASGLPAGTHALAWDGRDQAGRDAGSGIYLFRLQAGDKIFTGRMLRLAQ